MKRFLFIALAVGFIMTSADAAFVTPEEALQRAEKTGARKSASVSFQNFNLCHTLKSETGSPALYVFNKRNDAGYMILSADDVATPVLGYSDHGTFDYDRMPQQMIWWLEQYARQIQYAVDNNISASNTTAINPEWKAIAPMISSRWNQDAPYNNDCPVYPPTQQRSVTGCVATAMAQVMNYWKYPEKGIGSVSYRPSGFSLPLTMDFSAQKFDWSNMLDRYISGSYNEAQAAAVAYLMKACGYSTEMSYSSYASGTQSYNVGKALINYFGYNKYLSYEQRDYYTTTEWNNMVYSELAAGRPILYSGVSPDGGHEFVCDGYSNDGFFHINWGWGGMSDGYFKLESLDPSSQGIGGGGGGGFYYGQDILKGVQKTEFANSSAMELIQGGNLSATASGTRVTPKLSGSSQNGIWNWQYNSLNVTIGLEISPIDNLESKTYELIQTANISGRSGYNSLQSIAFPTNLGNAKYKCVLVFRNNNEQDPKWKEMRHNSSYANYFYITKNGNVLTIENISPLCLKMTDAKVVGEIYYQCNAEVGGTFVNSSDEELNCYVVPVIYNSSNKQILNGTASLVSLSAGETALQTWNTSFSLVSGVSAPTSDISGILKFKNKATGDFFDAQIPVLIKIPEAVKPSAMNFKITGMQKETVNGIRNVWIVTQPDQIKATFTLVNSLGYFAYPTLLYIADPSTGYLLQTAPLDIPGIASGDFESVSGEISFGDFIEGKLYNIGVLYQVGSQITSMLSSNFLIRIPSKLNECEFDLVDPIEYYDLQGRKLNGEPEHGMYLKRQGGKTVKIVR